jgi:repressor of nif and glnA expression
MDELRRGMNIGEQKGRDRLKVLEERKRNKRN